MDQFENRIAYEDFALSEPTKQVSVREVFGIDTDLVVHLSLIHI